MVTPGSTTDRDLAACGSNSLFSAKSRELCSCQDTVVGDGREGEKRREYVWRTAQNRTTEIVFVNRTIETDVVNMNVYSDLIVAFVPSLFIRPGLSWPDMNL